MQRQRGVRALDAGPAFWTSMFAASALGTNIGDLWVDGLGLSRAWSFASLALICAFAVWGDRLVWRRTEALYWVAIVALRAGATNVADAMTHDLGLNDGASAAVLAVLALGAGCWTRSGAAGSPVIEGWYWAAMLVAGVFGTMGGDLAAHSIGLFAAAALLAAVLAAVLAVRARWFAAATPAYWCAVLAERAAGTPAGDALASRRGAGLGLLMATACTLSMFLLALAWRERRRRATEAPETTGDAIRAEA